MTFKDPQRMVTVLSGARRRLMSEVMREPKSINELTSHLHRYRSATAKDVGMLEKMGVDCSESTVQPEA